MRAGDRIALVYPSANRDEAVFDEPFEVDLARDPNPHVAFGFGTHFCLGAHVARLTMRVALEELTKRFTNLRPVGSPAYEANVLDRNSVVSGKSVSVRVDLGGRRIIKKKKHQQITI